MQPSEQVILTVNGGSANELVAGKAEHKTGGTFLFLLGIASEPDPACIKGGLIRMMRIEQNGRIHYLYADGSRRLEIQGPELEDVIAELLKSFN